MINATVIYIWEPRYSTNEALIDVRKVKQHNIIEFTKGSYKGRQYYISGETAQGCPKDTNGSITCYAVPMGKLELMAQPESKQKRGK